MALSNGTAAPPDGSGRGSREEGTQGAAGGWGFLLGCGSGGHVRVGGTAARTGRARVSLIRSKKTRCPWEAPRPSVPGLGGRGQLYPSPILEGGPGQQERVTRH